YLVTFSTSTVRLSSMTNDGDGPAANASLTTTPGAAAGAPVRSFSRVKPKMMLFCQPDGDSRPCVTETLCLRRSTPTPRSGRLNPPESRFLKTWSLNVYVAASTCRSFGHH